MIKYINLLLFSGMIVMNYLANALPLNNKTTGQLADSYPNLFVPAGITFSIWGVIYLLLAGFCAIQFLGSHQGLLLKIGWLFAWSCLLNGIWIVCWHYEKLPLSLLVMILLLAVLTLLNFRIQHLSMGLLKATFGIYLGWICIATIANVTAVLVHYNWNGFGISEEIWAIIMIMLGACIASWALVRLRNPFIGLSAIWAFTGIMLKRQDDYPSIVVASWIAIALVAGIAAWRFFQKNTCSLI
jgi:hypothetical protein